MKILKWLRDRELKRLQKNNRLAYEGFAECKKVALFFTAGKPADAEIEKYRQALENEGKEVHLLAYFPYKKKDQAANFKHRNYASNEVDWLGKPNAEDFKRWINEPYDVYIDLNTLHQKSFAFVRAMINAKLCIGFGAQKKEWADVGIKVEPTANNERTIQEILKYMKLINKAS